MRISPRTREECDASTDSAIFTSWQFQPTHSRRVRHEQNQAHQNRWPFQPTHSRRVRRGAMPARTWAFWFQPTHSRRVRQGLCGNDIDLRVFQPTHSRRVRLVVVAEQHGAEVVSTHALAKSATSTPCAMTRSGTFQPTHSRRVRHDPSISMSLLASFNPRTREECDADFAAAKAGSGPVSTHALAKSATGRYSAGTPHHHCFNPRTREECDNFPTQRPDVATRFNPRTREECDATIHHACALRFAFQPTHSRRVRPWDAQVDVLVVLVSTHALAKSATPAVAPEHADELVSTHALAKSATRRRRGQRHRWRVSTHALAKSATWHAWLPRRSPPCFNPRTREECDAGHGTDQSVHPGFNPRTREECDTCPVAWRCFITTFQPTHSRRVRQVMSMVPVLPMTFQPTHSRRVRPQRVHQGRVGIDVSTHALAKSATRGRCDRRPA